MNPGLLSQRCLVEEQTTSRDASGQPLDEWEEVASFRARRIKPKANSSEATLADREREKRKAVFRRRVSASTAGKVKHGQRLTVLAERGRGAELWEVVSVQPCDADPRAYEDITAEMVS